MNYLATLLIVVIAIILYYLYYFITNNELTSGLQSLDKLTVVDSSKLKNPNSYTYSFQCWLYMSTMTNTPAVLYCTKSGSGNDAKSVFEVLIKGQTLTLKAGTGSSDTVKIMDIAQDFPIQKWTYLVVNVYNLQTFEAYINGKLAKTVQIQSSTNIKPVSNKTALSIGGCGSIGYVTKFTRTEKTLDAKTVWEKYLGGNGLSNWFSSIIPYGLSLSISKGEELQKSIAIF
jgi:hypothetical protein